MTRRHLVALPVFVVSLGMTGFASRANEVQQAKPAPRPAERAPEPARLAPQGFSVVLVLGDLQAAGGEDDVPTAARKALADMRDFLPYKSYKLLDATWIMGTSRATSRMRGPDDREFELEISASQGGMARLVSGETRSPTDGSRLYVQFVLREAMATAEDGSETLARPSTRVLEQRLDLLRKELSATQAEYERARAQSAVDHPEAARLQRRIAELTNQMAEIGGGQTRAAVALTKMPPRSIINTSFTMDIGETVVVGTSRLKSNSKALIAQHTAVPPRGGRR